MINGKKLAIIGMILLLLVVLVVGKSTFYSREAKSAEKTHGKTDDKSNNKKSGI